MSLIFSQVSITEEQTNSVIAFSWIIAIIDIVVMLIALGMLILQIVLSCIGLGLWQRCCRCCSRDENAEDALDRRVGAADDDDVLGVTWEKPKLSYSPELLTLNELENKKRRAESKLKKLNKEWEGKAKPASVMKDFMNVEHEIATLDTCIRNHEDNDVGESSSQSTASSS